MDETALLLELERLRDVMEESWRKDVLQLRASSLAFGRIAPALAPVGNDGVLLRTWFRDHMLAGVRRIVDTGPDVVGVRQALLDLRRIADQITPSVVLAHLGPHPQWDDDLNREFSEAWVAKVVSEARPDEPEADVTAIGVRTVQADLDRLRDIGDRAHRLATLITAHRLDRDEQVEVSQEEIDELLDAATEVYVRWSLILRGADVDGTIEHFQLGWPLREALTLYRPDQVVEAITARNRRLDAVPVWNRTEAVELMRVDYSLLDE